MDAKLNNLNIVVLGDTHSIKTTCYLAKTRFPENATIVHMGDGGELGDKIYPECHFYLNKMNNALVEKNSTLLVVRGNHSDPEYFVQNSRYNRSNIVFVPDYSVIEINGKNCLFVGGATSIDRKYRTEGKDYWKDEIFVYDEAKIREIQNKYSNIFAIFTHCPPSFSYPYGLGPMVKAFSANDPTLIEELKKERDNIQALFLDFPSVKLGAAGHMHDSDSEMIGKRLQLLLNIDELKDVTRYFG